MATLAVSNIFAANTLITSSSMNANFDDVEAVVNALTSVNYAANSVNTAAIATAAVTSLKGGLGINTSASAQGGVPYLNGTGTWAILAAGTSNQWFVTKGTGANPVFQGALAARVSNSANISIANDTNTVLTFDTESFDTDTIHSTVTNTGRLTATSAGRYVITGDVQFAGNATGIRALIIRVNGTTAIMENTIDIDAASNHELVVATIYNLAANDYVELLAYQSSGGALNVETTTGPTSPVFSMAWLGV